MDEAASDVYGLLNIGPLFVFNLAAFFTSLVHQLSGGRTPLGVLSNRTFLDENNQPDVHPTDLLRVSLALGVIESLHGLSVTRRSAYVQAVTQLLEVCTGGAQDIEIVAVRPGGQLQVVQTLPLDQMQEAAHQAGAFIANSVLKALGGHSIQEIETWDDEDENKLQEIVTALTAGQPIAGQGDDAQILAAATFALLQAPNQYDQVTALVNTALDASFASDPIFGRPRRQRVLFRPELARRINVARPVSPPSLLALRFALTRAASSAAAKRGDA